MMTSSTRVDDMDEAPLNQEEPPNLRFLRRLVTVLTVTMIAGLLTIIALFVIRFSQSPKPILPAEITLPDGTQPLTFTQGNDWYAVVTTEDEILIFDRVSNELRETIKINTNN